MSTVPDHHRVPVSISYDGPTDTCTLTVRLLPGPWRLRDVAEEAVLGASVAARQRAHEELEWMLAVCGEEADR